MKESKRVLSVLLVAAMLFSLMIFSSAETLEPGIHDVGPGNLAGGKVQIVGQKTVASYNTLTNSDTIIKVVFKVFMDRESYWGIFGASFCLPVYDSEYLTLVRNRPAHIIDGQEADEYQLSYLTGSQYFQLSFLGGDCAENPLGVDGYAIEFEFDFKPTAKFATLDPTVGTEVTMTFDPGLTGTVDVSMRYTNNSNLYLQGRNEDVLTSKAAVVTYAASMITYDVGAGSRADMTAFAPKAAKAGDMVVLADGTGLAVAAAANGGIAQVFDYWTDGTRNYNSGESTAMPNNGLALTAVYADDADGDGIADKYEKKVTYTLRTGDSGTIVAPATNTDNGFFITEGANKVIFVEEGDKIGNSIATVDLTAAGLEDWKFIGYFVNGTMYTAATLKDLVITANTEIELRTMPDKNDNGIDDRDPVTINFYTPGGELVETMVVPDGTPYTIYGDPNKATTAATGSADSNPKNVNLPTVPATIPGGKHIGWTVEPIKDGAGKIVGIEAVPTYSDDQQVEIPELRDPTDPEKPVAPPIVSLPAGSILIHNGVDGKPIGTPTTIGSVDAIQLITNPVPGQHSNLPKRDGDNNPFAGWILSDPVIGAGPGGEDVYYLNPYYSAPIVITVADPKSEKTLDDDIILDGFDGESVPSDSTYEVRNDNGGVIDSGKFADKDGGKLTLPKKEALPERNNDGDIFTGDWIATEEVNPDGSPKYVFTPEYREPTAEDVTVIIDEDPLAGVGLGLSILKGFYANEITATAEFLIRIGNAPARSSDASRLSVSAAPVYGFEGIVRPERIVGSDRTIAYTGTRIIDGVEYGVFRATYKTVQSGIVKLGLNYGNAAVSGAKGHIVVTVGDCDINGLINSADQTAMLRVINRQSPTPAKGVAGGYIFELMNVDKNDIVNAADATILLRMINRLIDSN